MKTALLVRKPSTPEGTFGRLTYGGHAACTLELDWVDANGDGIGDPEKSCVTKGVYRLHWQLSNRVKKIWPQSGGWCYEVTNVKGRSRILIHPANLAPQELRGCLALGQHFATFTEHKGVKIAPQKGISGSRTAVQAFNDWGAKDDIELTIQ